MRSKRLGLGICLGIAALFCGCEWNSSLYDTYVNHGKLVNCPPRMFAQENQNSKWFLVAPDKDNPSESVCVDWNGQKITNGNCIELKQINGNIIAEDGTLIHSWAEFVSSGFSQDMLIILSDGSLCEAGSCAEYEDAFAYHICPNDYSSCSFEEESKQFYCRMAENTCVVPSDCVKTSAGWESGSCDDGICHAQSCKLGYHLYEDERICEVNSRLNCGAHGRNCSDNDSNPEDDVHQCTSAGECVLTCETIGKHEFEDSCEDNSLEHCGSHFNDCSTIPGWANGDCVNKNCVASVCLDGYHLDGRTCVVDDVNNCGGKVCKDGYMCEQGRCVPNCVSGVLCVSEQFGPRCIDPMTDAEFCGANAQCENGVSCDTKGGEVCIGGQCIQHSCPIEGQNACLVASSGTFTIECLDFLTNHDHCGFCNHSCTDDQNCVDGVCTCADSALTKCDNVCVDLKSDEKYCGSCSNQCSANQKCLDGVCVCANGNQTMCGEICVDLKTDAKYCGTCEDQCSSGQFCSQGKCACSDTNLTMCGSSCVNTKTNVRYCGGCDKMCGANQKCEGGKCACSNSGQTLCGSICVDTKTNPRYCGSCDKMCGTNQKCTSGKCACNDSKLTVCNGTCYNLQSDVYNCGRCSNRCGANQKCSYGKCVQK